MFVCSGSREGWKRWRAVTWRSFNGELRRGGVCALHVLSARVVSAFAESAGVPRCFLFVQKHIGWLGQTWVSKPIC